MGKSKNTEVKICRISLALSPEAFQIAQDGAKRENRSLTNFLETLLLKSVKEANHPQLQEA